MRSSLFHAFSMGNLWGLGVMVEMRCFGKVLAGWAVCLSAVLGSSADAAEQGTTLHVLGNGLTVLIREKHSTPVVAVQVWYRVGSQNEGKGERGMAHLFEHMMFRGSEQYGPEEHARRISEAGGSSNAYTFFDRTVYHERLPSRSLELALKLEADRMARLSLTQGLLDTERNVVLEEFRERMDNPYYKLFAAALEALYPNHPYGRHPLGEVADIQAFTLEACRAFYARYYAPNNAVLVIVGDTAPAHALELCDRYFAAIPSGPGLPMPDLSLKPKPKAGPYRLTGPIPMRVTAVVFHIPEAGHPDIIPLQVLAQILSAGESSRLFRTLVKEKGLAVVALGYPQIVQGPGVFACGAAHFPSISSRRLERAIMEEVDRLKTEDVTEQELAKARKQLLGKKVFERYSVEDLAEGLGSAEVIQGDYHRFDEEVAAFRGVTAADVRRVANTYFTESNRTVLYVKPKRLNGLVWLYGFVKPVF